MRRLLFLAFLLSACRDAPDRFAAPDPFDSIPAGDAGRLTWNVYYDQTPIWNASSDSVYYSAASYPGFGDTDGLLLSIPRATGRAKVLLEALQGDIVPRPFLLAPAISRDRSSIAFVEITELHDSEAMCPHGGIRCPGVTDSGPDTTAANTPLERAVLRVRSLAGTGQESQLEIQFSGQNEFNPIAYPFQRQFERDRSQIFRPSWSPDGTRLVFSDGLQLYVWVIGSNTATPIPNTQDGVWPAWSPNGDVIAFTRLFREGSHTVGCVCIISERGIEPMTRTIYHDRNQKTGQLVTIRLDGSQSRDLGIGEAPAWTPDGQSIVVARNNEIWRIAADGSSASAVPTTAFGFEPAVSPDGRWLTFSRSSLREFGKDYDIWVVGF